MRRRLIGISGFGLTLAGFLAVWLAGTVLSAPARQPVGNLPADLAGRPVQFPSASGSSIHGWFLPGKPGTGAVVLMHGVRATRESMLGPARFLAEAGYSVLLFDFQAHGESSGEHVTFGYLESRDAAAAVNYLRAAAPGEKIGLIGVSMGGAAALLASPRLDVQAMVLEMVYPNIDRAITNRLTMRLGGWSGVLTPLLSWQFKPRLGVGADRLRPIDRVREVTAPKLFIAGAADRHTTIDESRQLFQAAAEPKELWVVEGAGHVDLHSAAKKEYEQRVLAFFKKSLR